jgi:hypothetical protein
VFVDSAPELPQPLDAVLVNDVPVAVAPTTLVHVALTGL